MVVEVGKLRFIRRTDAITPSGNVVVDPKKRFIVCVDPEWKKFISGATYKSSHSDYYQNSLEEAGFEYYNSELVVQENSVEEDNADDADFIDDELEEEQRTYDISDDLYSPDIVIMHPEGDINSYLKYIRDVKKQVDLAEEIHVKYINARKEMVNHYETKQKRLQYPAVAEKFNEIREKWELKNEGQNFKALMETTSSTVCLANWGILNTDFRLDVAILFKLVKLSQKAMSDISFLMAYLLFNDAIESKLCYFIPLFPKLRIVRYGLGSRVFTEIPLEGDTEDFKNFSQLVKIIKNIELGYKAQPKPKQRDMDYDEETKYLWYHLHNQGQSWSHISRGHNEANPGGNATKDKVRKAVERLFD